jgi:organic radical activating enzyme
MFGKNPVVSQHINDDGSLKIVDLFYTIQGEGPYSGMPAVFLRLADCNLRCVMCDTDFTSNARVLSSAGIVNEILEAAGKKTRLVVVTGGEPMLQNLVPVCNDLRRRNFRVQIETAGTIWVPGLEGCGVALVCSPKTAKVHREIAHRCIHYKYVVGAGDEVEDGKIVASFQLGTRPKILAQPEREDATIWIQPRDDQDDRKNATNLAFARDLCLEYGYRLCVQLHKIAGIP